MSESLRDLRLFVAAYEEGSFTAAAVRENATQSGVSQHMHKLEARFGVKLFSRETGTVTPTPAGDIYYRNCIEILRAYEQSKSEMKKFAVGLSGEIIVGLMPTMTRCALGPVLSAFVADNPNAHVRVVEGYSAMLTERVRSGDLAFAVVPSFQGGPGLNTRHFGYTPEVLVSAKNSPFQHMQPVRLRDLPPMKLILPSPENTRRRTLETALASNGAKVHRMLELDAMFGTLDLVANTDWVTILPGVMMASDVDREQFTLNAIVDPALMLELVLIEPMRQPMSPMAEEFLRLLEGETERLNRHWLQGSAAPKSERSLARSG